MHLLYWNVCFKSYNRKNLDPLNLKTARECAKYGMLMLIFLRMLSQEECFISVSESLEGYLAVIFNTFDGDDESLG